MEKYTKSGVPWKLIWSTSKETRGEALKLERKIKNLSRKRTVEFILKYSDGISSPDELLLINQLKLFNDFPLLFYHIINDYICCHKF